MGKHLRLQLVTSLRVALPFDVCMLQLDVGDSFDWQGTFRVLSVLETIQLPLVQHQPSPSAALFHVKVQCLME